VREGEQRSIRKSVADGLTQIGKVAGAIRPIRPTQAFVGLRLLPPDRTALLPQDRHQQPPTI